MYFLCTLAVPSVDKNLWGGEQDTLVLSFFHPVLLLQKAYEGSGTDGTTHKKINPVLGTEIT